MSHFGKPEGQVVEGLRLTPIQEKLMEYLDLSIAKSQDCIGKEVEDWVKNMQPGEVLLLENLRFHKEEEGGDLGFAKKLADLGDIYINDAFGACHRPHASIVGIPKYLESGIGLLLEKEINSLEKIAKNPKYPLVVVIGGKKVETKTKLINLISDIADFVLIGGLIKKEIDEKKIKIEHPQKITAPLDEKENGLDIGPKTVEFFKEKINLAKTIFWNGPLGRIEDENFAQGTKEIALAIAKSSAFSVVGGGETIDFVNKIGLTEKFGHLSTGGGAMMAFLSGEELPGIKALQNN